MAMVDVRTSRDGRRVESAKESESGILKSTLYTLLRLRVLDYDWSRSWRCGILSCQLNHDMSGLMLSPYMNPECLRV